MLYKTLQRGRDSNPRYVAVYTLSRRAPSTTRPPHHRRAQHTTVQVACQCLTGLNSPINPPHYLLPIKSRERLAMAMRATKRAYIKPPTTGIERLHVQKIDPTAHRDIAKHTL